MYYYKMAKGTTSRGRGGKSKVPTSEGQGHTEITEESSKRDGRRLGVGILASIMIVALLSLWIFWKPIVELFNMLTN